MEYIDRNSCHIYGRWLSPKLCILRIRVECANKLYLKFGKFHRSRTMGRMRGGVKDRTTSRTCVINFLHRYGVGREIYYNIYACTRIIYHYHSGFFIYCILRVNKTAGTVDGRSTFSLQNLLSRLFKKRKKVPTRG